MNNREDMQKAFEGQKFKVFSPFKCDISKNEDGNYVDDTTIFAFAWFCRGIASQAHPRYLVDTQSGEFTVMQSQSQQPTDLSKQLREYASDSGYSHNDYADTMLAAASEIERCAAILTASQAQQESKQLSFDDNGQLVDKSQAQQSSQWISVEDRLPEMETPVVALVGKNVYALARVDYDEGWLWAICGCDLSDIRDYEADEDYQPTYWMPLAIPPAPEGDKE